MKEKTTQARTKGDHRLFVEFFSETVERTRGFKPAINGPRDGATLKRILARDDVDRPMLEKLALYFLSNHRYEKLSPTISVFLSAGVLTSLWNAMLNNPDFWRELDGYSSRMHPAKVDREDVRKQLAALRAAFSIS